MIAVTVQPDQSEGTVVFTDSLSLTWRAAGQFMTFSGNNVGTEGVWYVNTGGASGSDTITATWATALTGTTLFVGEYNLNYTLDTNATAGQSASVSLGGTLTTGPVKPAIDNELLVYFAKWVNATTLTPTNSFVVEDTSATTSSLWADKMLGSSTAGTSQSATFSSSAASFVNSGLVAFLPVPAPASLTQSKCSNATGPTSGTVLTCTLTGTRINDLLVVNAGSWTSDAPTITDGFSLTWHTAIIQNAGPSQFATVAVFYAVTGSNSGSDLITATMGSSEAHWSIEAADFQGRSWTGNPLVFDVGAGLVGGVISLSSNTSACGALLITSSMTGQTGFNTGDLALTIGYQTYLREDHDPANNSNGLQWADKLSPGGPPYTATWNYNNGPQVEGALVGFGSSSCSSVRHKAEVY